MVERYYFHLRDEHGFVHDCEGNEFSDDEAAKSAVYAVIQRIVCSPQVFGNVLNWRGCDFMITHERGRVVALIVFSSGR
ncbi:hypothetical protein DC522_11880 [Microvirga sp. KLBC 81]|uniref:DUF6894 family protein n=1 Tax=Microvirga sp. KLBC 81 TaxID=1862707 RepID=UPI000D5060B7|nr:hypothetical protein [Microvirga sp. KLBC 81]PVE24177.1 hypothetical protein DC522_11880 [Microvirga sp. KLBC 81]